MTTPVQTLEFATQTTPVKLRVLGDSDTDVFTDEETDSRKKDGQDIGKRTKSEVREKKKRTKKQLEAGLLNDSEAIKGRKKHKKDVMPSEDTEIEESQSTAKSNIIDLAKDTGESIQRKRNAKKKKKEVKKAEKKKPKKEAKFLKGKINPSISLVNFDKEREDIDDAPFTSCCIDCSNRNPTRAVLTNNLTLMNNCISSAKNLSTLFDAWSPEIDHNAFYYALTTNNLNMLQLLLEVDKKPKGFCKQSKYLIDYLKTGEVSEQAFGVRVRKVQMARGNRQGNNAFLEKNYVSCIDRYQGFMEMLKNPMIESTTLEKLVLLDQSFAYSLYRSVASAVIAGNKKIAAYLVNKIKGLSNYGFNNLHYEVLTFNDEDLTQFYKQSVHKKAIENDCITPMHCACINPNPKYLQALVDADSNVNFADSFNRKPIHFAAACESSGPLELLFTYGANPVDVDSSKRSPLHYAAMSGRGANIRLLIDKAPQMLRARDKKSTMPLHYACMNGHLEAVKAFIEKGANPNIGSGPARMTPLGYAAAYNHIDICEYLINNKGKVLGKDKFKRSPLIMAARNGNVKVLNLLLRKGAIWDDPDSSGNTALHYATAYGWTECAEELIKAGANVNANSSWKITPLNIAMLKNHFGLVKYLLNMPNINVNCKDEQGRTLVSLAVELLSEGSLNYVTYLLKEKKADPNIPDINSHTPLYYLVTKNICAETYSTEEQRYLTEQEIEEQTHKLAELRKSMIVLLLKYNANINVLDKDGHTLFDSCLESGNYELMELFTGIASFKTQPALIFSFAKLIYNPKLKTTFNYLLKNSTMNSFLMNTVDNEGFTPFLRYLKTFIDIAEEAYSKMYSHIKYNLKKMKYEGDQSFTKEALKMAYMKTLDIIELFAGSNNSINTTCQRNFNTQTKKCSKEDNINNYIL